MVAASGGLLCTHHHVLHGLPGESCRFVDRLPLAAVPTNKWTLQRWPSSATGVLPTLMDARGTPRGAPGEHVWHEQRLELETGDELDEE
jgi:hypothetical protein